MKVPGCGTVFSVTPSGTENVLHRFTGGSDGARPAAAPVDVNGTLYGTTEFGGGSGCKKRGCGTVFSITTSGSEKVLHSFTGLPDGAYPVAPLVDAHGTLYGTTREWGIAGRGVYRDGSGTVYSITTKGAETVLHSFSDNASDAVYPLAGLINVNGTLYGTSFVGGEHRQGTVYTVGLVRRRERAVQLSRHIRRPEPGRATDRRKRGPLWHNSKRRHR